MEQIVELSFELLGTKIAPKEISRMTGILPSIELLRGEINSSREIPRQNIWAFESKIKSVEIIDLWEELQAALENSKDKIKDIAKTGRVKFTILIESQHRLPSIQIPSSMAAFAGFVDAMIDIDHLQS